MLHVHSVTPSPVTSNHSSYHPPGPKQPTAHHSCKVLGGSSRARSIGTSTAAILGSSIILSPTRCCDCDTHLVIPYPLALSIPPLHLPLSRFYSRIVISRIALSGPNQSRYYLRPGPYRSLRRDRMRLLKPGPEVCIVSSLS